MIAILAHLPLVAAAVSSINFDVVVYGATPGGVQAAVAAGREGKNTALLEPSLYVGGAISGGLGQADYGQHAPIVLGGQSKEFFERVASYYNVPFSFPPDRQCGKHEVPWVSEPHVAEQILVDMLREANVTILMDHRIVKANVAVASAGRGGSAAASNAKASGVKRIDSVTTATGDIILGTVFVDGTYEGALMKMAGCSYTFGREANTTYNEPSAGRLPTFQEQPDWPHGDRTAQLPNGINPFVDATNTTLIYGVWGGEVAPPGGADRRVGSYDWRVTLTDNVSNMVPIPVPDDYNPAEFELFRRTIALSGGRVSTPGTSIPNSKTDWKMAGSFGEHANFQWGYPNGTWEEQQAIVAEFKRFGLSLLHFMATDPAVPAETRAKMKKLGLCKDEYNRSDHWMSQLYVRSALRLVSDRVLTESDVVSDTWLGPGKDCIGLGAYTVDIPGPVQTIVIDGQVVNEGALKVPTFCDPNVAPFALPYSIMVPKSDEVANLLVPVAVSASHIAFNTIRLEPTWMILGQSAGVAAAMACDTSGSLNNTKGVVSAVNVTALQDKLVALGQVLEPRQPPPPQPVDVGVWYAWKPMFNYTTGSVQMTPTQSDSLLKRDMKVPSKDLPASEVCRVQAGSLVALAKPATNASTDYWEVELAHGKAQNLCQR